MILPVLLWAAVAEPPARFAIVVGQNKPDGGAETLRYADDDAAQMAELLREAGVRVTLLARLDDTTRRRGHAAPDGLPTRDALERAFDDVRDHALAARASGRPSELLFAFSGHGGVARGRGYLVLEDGRLDRDELERLLHGGAADTTNVIIDACRSFYIALPRGAGGSRARAGSIARSQPRGTGYVLSTSSDRESHEYEPFQAGIFSYEVRSALRGAADVDGDGAITYAELGAFLKRANSEIKNERYRPDTFVRPPPGDGVLLAWPSPPTLVVDSETGARVAIYNEASEHLVDVTPAPGFAPPLHLPRSRPLQIVSGTGATALRTLADVSDEPVRISTLPGHAAVVIGPKDGNPAAPELERLFQAPFGAEDVRSFQDDPLPEFPQDPPDPLAVWGVAGIGVGAGCVLASFLATSAGYEVFRGGTDAPNDERQQRNRQITALNWTAGIVGGVGAAALAGGVVALTWRELE